MTLPASSSNKSSSRERFERIYGAIREKICMLEYQPGALLSEDRLALQFGVSRTPLRHVLARLEAEGLVERKHGVGTFVTDFNDSALEDVYQFRQELSCLMGRLSPLARSPADLARMRLLAERGRQLAAAPTMIDFTRLNLDYSLELTSMIGNLPLKESFQRQFFLAIRIWIKTLGQEQLQPEASIFSGEIEDVLRAFEVGDLEAVGYLHRTHISMSFARLRRYLAARPQPAASGQ